MITTLAAVRQEMCRYLDDWLPGTTTTFIAADNYVFSTELQAYGDRYFVGYFLLITSGNNTGVCRQVKDSVQQTGRLELYGAVLAAEAANVTFELHRYDPTKLNQWINRAAIRGFPMLSVKDMSPNSHFEDWSQAAYPDNWRVSGVTASESTAADTIHNGTKSCALTRAGGVDGYLYVSTNLSSELPVDLVKALYALRGQRVTFAKWAKTSAPSMCKLTIFCGDDAALQKSSPYHSGSGLFEYLEVTFEIPWNVSTVEFRCEVVGTDGTCYFDGAGLGQKTVEYGLGFLSSVSADTDGIEANNDQAQALACLAASMYLESQIMLTASDSVTRLVNNVNTLRQEANMRLMSLAGDLPIIHVGGGWTEDFPMED